MGVVYNPSVVTDGLVLCLDAGNTKSYPGSGTAWNDLSGRGNNGILQNGVGYTGANGGILTFDGSDDWVSMTGVNPTIDNDFTHIVWAKRDGDSPSSIGGIFGNHFHTQLSGAGMFFRNNSTYVEVSAGNGVTRPSHRVNIPKTNLEWNCYAIRYSGTTYEVYFNGVLLDSRTAVVVQSANTNRFAIGRWASSFNSYYLNGKISVCCSYNIALTSQQIQQNFAALRGRFGI